ncbi:phospholipase [Paraprevotella clara]|uniref:phospholipase n=1 Tax=Paraprevotella clara TaxID=454154 RepID=UPI003AB4983B
MIIIYILIALAAAAVIAFVAGSLRNRSLKKKLAQGEISEMPTVVQPPQECCGQHEVCEKESLLAAVSKQIEYYNDEELDRFRGKDASAYSETETDEFRDILYTMRDDEVAGWVRSLQLRGVPLPDTLKDEVFLIIGERRFDHA